MLEPYYWYVLYVKTGSENRVVQDISRFAVKRGREGDVEPFCPESEFYYRSKEDRRLGKTYRKRPLFPGYVFVETTMTSPEFLREFGTYARGADDVIRILRNGNSEYVALSDDERRRLEFLLRGKRCFEHSIGVIVGDKVIVHDGPLKDLEGAITRINRHNRTAEIELEMFGGTVKARVALEIIEKKD